MTINKESKMDNAKMKEVFEAFENEDFIKSKEELVGELRVHMDSWYQDKLGLKESIFAPAIVDESEKSDDMQIKLKAILNKLVDAVKDGKTDSAKNIKKMANGMLKQISKEGGLSPQQASWIFKTWSAFENK